jgi:general secretion pathway protein D
VGSSGQYTGPAFGNPYGGGFGSYPTGGTPFNLGVNTAPTPGGTGGPAGTADLTGQYLGNQPTYGLPPHIPRIIPNPLSNTLMIQATPEDYQDIVKLLKELDLPPRQVLIEARIYEVDLTKGFSSDVQTQLQQKDDTVRQFLGNFAGAATNLNWGTLVGRSRQLLTQVQLLSTENRAKVISAPSVVATDSIAASINVGTSVPTLTAQAVTGVQQGGNSLFANTVTNQDSGITLSVTARVNPSGIVTLVIDQQTSTPIPPSPGGIQSPSFSKRTVKTQVTVQDGDTIAIGGIIDEQSTFASSGIPLLHRIPIIGAAFGFRSYNKERTELIIFITPKVIYDTNGISEATDELKGRLKALKNIVKD